MLRALRRVHLRATAAAATRARVSLGAAAAAARAISSSTRRVRPGATAAGAKPLTKPVGGPVSQNNPSYTRTASRHTATDELPRVTQLHGAQAQPRVPLQFGHSPSADAGGAKSEFEQAQEEVQQEGMSGGRMVYHALLYGGAVAICSFAAWQFFFKPKSYLEGKAQAGITPSPFEYHFGSASEGELKNMKLFAGRVNRELAEDIAKRLGIELSGVKLSTFADGEIGVQVQENVRGSDCFIVTSVSKPVNDNLMELLLMISAMRRASAQSITAVITYMSYSRQDRKFTSRVPISAADFALMLSTLGVDRVIAVDLHSGQIQGFFPPRVPVTHLLSGFVGATFFAEKQLKNPVVVACDSGGVGRAKHFRDVLSTHGHEDASGDIAMVLRKKPTRDRAGHTTGSAEAPVNLVGSVADSDVILIGDIIDSAQTMVRAAEEVKKNGARHIYAFAPHGVFNGDAVARIEGSALEEVVVTNTCPLPPAAAASSKIRQITLAPLLAEAVKRVHNNQSVSLLFASPTKGNKGKAKANGDAATAAAPLASVAAPAAAPAATAEDDDEDDAVDDKEDDG